MTRALRAIAVGVLGAALTACSSKPRAGVVHELAYAVMEPTYGTFAANSQALADSVASLCGAVDDAHLSSAQDAWRAAREPWKKSAAFRFGPGDSLGVELDYWPVRADSVERAIGEVSLPVTLEALAQLGAPAKGLPALEYLLFQPASGDDSVLRSLSPETDAGRRRCAYASGVAQAVAATAAELGRAWSPSGGKYVRALGDAGDDTSAFQTPQAALNGVMNGLVLALEDMTGRELAVPLGSKTSGAPQPDESESRFSDNALADLGNTLAGVRAVYYGGPGVRGLSHLVQLRNPGLDPRVRAQFDDTANRLAAIPAPLRSAVLDHRETVQATLDSGLELRRLIAVDVLSTLGVTATFNINDGD